MINIIKAVLLSGLIALTGCAEKPDKTLNIIANSWIGYSPLFYAKEKGWLDEHDIHLSSVVSLGESLHIYQSAKLDAFAGTQYEYQIMYRKDPSVIPVMLLDRSNGGDMIMGNRSLDAIKSENGPINVYLEINSINYPVFNDFIHQHKLEGKTFNYINRDQLKLQSVAASETAPSLVVTYTPYNHELEDQGFQTLASTADGLNLLVLDGIFTTENRYHAHKDQMLALKTLINHAIQALHDDPKEYYEKVKPYLENSSFEDFKTSLNTIEWLNGGISPALQKRLDEANFPTRDLL
jgi:NitT/TauT family transport system substrate-binding protein